MNSAEVILKTVERCNIDCTYCYFFYSPNQRWQKHPPYIAGETLKSIATFIKQGCLNFDLNSLTIGFHGGEPLMQKKQDFIDMCALFQKELADIVSLHFGLQTNGMLIDAEWLEIFKKYQINFGISLDGPAEYNDRYRVDKLKRGTHARVVERIKYLNETPDFQKNVGVLSVINPEFSAKKIYHHFVGELNISKINFILPDYNYENKPPFLVGALFSFIKELFDEWVKNQEVTIDFFNMIFEMLDGNSSITYGIGKMPKTQLHLISISSNGELSPTDEVAALDSSIGYSGATTFNTEWKDYMNEPIFHKLTQAQETLPVACSSCPWQVICGGGSLVNRYSKSNGFNNPSIYCEDLKEIYAMISAYMLENGYSYGRLLKNLSLA